MMNSATERRPRIYSRTSHRLREVERIIAFRHAAERPLSRAGCIPDTDDADVYLDQAACCLLVLMWKKTGTKPDLAALLERLDLWCERFGPDTSAKLRRDVVRAVLRRPRLDNADDCARRLRLSYAERTRLKITTIGSYDLDKRQRTLRRKARKRERDRLRDAAKRAAAGAVSRAEYLVTHSLSRERPWETEGISRRTWYRRQMAVGTGCSPSSVSTTLGEGLVSRSRSGRPGTARPPLSASAAVTTVRARGPRRGQRAALAGPATHAVEQPVAIAA